MVKFKKWGWMKKMNKFKDDLLQPIKKSLIIKKRLNQSQVLDLKCDVKVVSNVVKLKDCDIKLIDDPIDPNPEVVVETEDIEPNPESNTIEESES